MHRTTCWISVALLVMMVFSSISLGQETQVTVEANVSDTNATMGGGVLYTIVVKGSTEPAEPVLGDMDGFDVEYLGPMTSRQSSYVIRNGKTRQVQTAKTTFRYLVTPTREGAIRIPPAAVVIDGKQFDTQAIWIDSKRPKELEDFKFRLTADSTSVYVNQPIEVRATWYVGADVQSYLWSVPDIGAFKVVLPPSTRSTPSPAGRNLVPVRIGRDEVYGERGTDMIAGRSFTTVSVRLIIIPTTPGSTSFGPMMIQFDRPVRSQNSFIRTTVNQREIIASNELSFDVKSPPANLAPPDYRGLVGQYKINASISATDVNVGDPIELTIQLVGDPFVMPGAAPDLTLIDGVAGAFKLSPDGWREETSGQRNERIYRTTIRAVHDRVDEVPPITLHFFDPKSESYRTSASAPLPVTVRPTREVTAADAIGVLTTSPTVTSPLLSRRAGLPANRTGPDVLRSDRPNILAFASTPTGGLLLASPALIYGAIVLGVGRVRRRDDATHRRRRALRNAKRRLRHAPPSTAASLAVQLYVAETFDLKDRAITGQDCQQALAPVDAEIATKFKAILDAQESDSFGLDPQPGEFALSSVRADLVRIDRLLRREKP